MTYEVVDEIIRRVRGKQKIKKSVEEIFREYADIRDCDECIPWSGRVDNGYGVFSHNGTSIKAHRISYILYVGEVLEGKHVHHICNNRICVNPKHLYVGEERFRKYADIRDCDECIPWTGSVDGTGYGICSYNGTHMRAHRTSYLLYVGEILNGKHVCHICNNRICVNPKHLKLCTPAENAKDAKNRGSHKIRDKHLKDGILKGKTHKLQLNVINKRLKEQDM